MSSVSSKKILVIEDEDSLRKAVIAALKREGFEVVSAANGQEGLDVALAEKPDLILLDHLMPTMSGMTMLEELRKDEWGANAQVIFTTNTNEISMVNKAMSANVQQYLVKSDISLEKLVGFVKETLGL